MNSAGNRWKTAFRLLAVAGAVALLGGVVARADLEKVSGLVADVGLLGMLMLLLPGALAVSAETHGWRLAIRILGRHIGFLPLLRVRLASEALGASLPAGALFAESVKPLLLSRHGGLSVNEGVAASVGRKYFLVLSQAAYLGAAAALGFGALVAISRQLVGVGTLSYLPFVASAVLFAIAGFMTLGLRRSAVATGVFALLSRLGSVRFSAWLARFELRFHETDATVAAFFRSGARRRVLPALFFTLGWFFETLETFMLLRALGADVGLLEVAALESVVTLLRHVAFVVPAGLGVQDLGYVTGFGALGVPDAATLGAAFVLLKRVKDLGWVALGYALLGAEAGLDGAPAFVQKIRLSAVR